MNNWIKWKGGSCPVDGDVMVEVRNKNDDLITAKASNINWLWGLYLSDVKAYRVLGAEDFIAAISNEQANISRLTEQSEQLNKALSEAKNNLETLINQLEKEITDKTGLSCVIGVWTSFKGVSEQGIVKVLSANEKQDKLTSLCELPEGVDINDPVTWKDGDIVKCVNADAQHPLTVGKEYVFNGYDEDDEYISIKKDDNDRSNGFHREVSSFQFVRRP